MEIQGKIYQLGETESIGVNDFKKRQIVVETEEEYSRKIPIDFVQEKTVLLDGLQVGQSVKVSFNLKGSESNGKHFLSANGWKVEKQ